MIKDKNFSNQIVPHRGDVLFIDTKYKDCNFSHSNCFTVFGQKVGHRIFPDDDTSRTFIDCNLTNCEPPPGSIIMKANGQHIGPTIVERMVKVNTEIVSIDSEQIEVDDYVDRIHGHYYQGVYSYKATPIDIPRRAE